MTREEAIEIFESVSFFAPSNIDVDTALDMAIEALKQDEHSVYKSEIDAMPTADVVEVVRCKDCKYHGATIEEQPTPSIMCAHMHDNDYCSYGERKDDKD